MAHFLNRDPNYLRGYKLSVKGQKVNSLALWAKQSPWQLLNCAAAEVQKPHMLCNEWTWLWSNKVLFTKIGVAKT